MRCSRLVAASSSAALTWGCETDWPQTTLGGAGAPAEILSQLSSWVYVAFAVVTLVMWALLAWIALRKRGTLAEHEPVDAGGGQPWILIGGFAVPFVILAVVFVYGLQVMSEFPLHDGEGAAPEIRVVGHQWWWEVQYVAGPPYLHFETANEIHIPVGRLVDVELASADVIHSFWVPKLHGKVDLVPGQPNRIRLRVDQPGIYSGQCSEFCGAQHANMRILVVAQPQEEYERWLMHHRQPAAPPRTTDAMQGLSVFMSGPCAFCHTIRGTHARGGVAPDLTHVASREGLAANLLDNNRANLSAWVTHAQSLKPEVMMPNVTMFTGEELRALVAYLEQLE